MQSGGKNKMFVSNSVPILPLFQEKTEDAKKAKKEENGDAEEEDEDDELGEEDIEDYDLAYNEDDELEGEGETNLKHLNHLNSGN